ncbi:MAG: ABC transporter permease subunit, partial [Chloroflexi bacterium]|nr:ABC transporter permease subunit [Chloroflexota bacterium]
NANPVLVKELRGRMRGARAFIILTVFLLILAVPTLLIYLSVAESVRFDPFSAGQTIGKSLFIGVVTIALIQIMIVVPGQAASAITSEKESETYDLLISTLLPPWKIILGKLAAALAYALMLIVAVIPFMAVSFLFGGVTIQEFLLALLGLFVTVMLFGSIGILWSVIMRRSLAATIVTQATSVVVLLGIPFLMVVFAILFLSRSPEPLWASSRVFVYLWTMFLSLHPFMALGASELLLSDGQTGLFFPAAENTISFLIPFSNRNGALQNFMLPQPWLIYTIQAVLLSALLVFFSIRLLRPLDDRPPRRRRRK